MFLPDIFRKQTTYSKQILRNDFFRRKPQSLKLEKRIDATMWKPVALIATELEPIGNGLDDFQIRWRIWKGGRRQHKREGSGRERERGQKRFLSGAAAVPSTARFIILSRGGFSLYGLRFHALISIFSLCCSGNWSTTTHRWPSRAGLFSFGTANNK